METVEKTKFVFPVGYHPFHRNQLYNFQLNRWHSLGYLPYEAMVTAGKKVSDFRTWKTEMSQLAELALAQENLVEAAFYYRAAEFYTMLGDPDKEHFSDQFSELFYAAFADDGIETHQIPYADSFMHAIRLPQTQVETKKGTIIFHGGFDSFIEEFYAMMRHLAEAGYEVIGFDGPGQGVTRRRHGLAFDIAWEKPTKALLDYFDLDGVTLIGLSMGGWLGMRAAAFEKRIKRMIASGYAYDYYKIPPAIAQWLMTFFNTWFKGYSNKVSYKSIAKGGMEGWQISNLMYITKSETPMSAFDFAMQMNEENLHAELIEQDVLVLTGRDDHFIPYKLHDKQIAILTNAQTVMDKVFFEQEQAQNHCQIGNIGLALETMLAWLDERSSV